MITLTRFSGSVFLLNADLIERVDSTPDTVITLMDGKKYVVCEPMSEVLDAVVAYRAEIVSVSALLEAAHAARQLAPPTPRNESRTRLAAVVPVAADNRAGGDV
ncbi:flagellar protein FlbD [Nocardioides terrae]|uniref:Flagellar protein FlbD n=1 Tax=Nocardioides terrae TaxID=574651 RepID=A0A1I1IA15_9ACTN|nr:flagellar FlbD family protein [Nocardioides terrae]SFC33004.1 flagellar protein FlbD [Nocardioides terrae]